VQPLQRRSRLIGAGPDGARGAVRGAPLSCRQPFHVRVHAFDLGRCGGDREQTRKRHDLVRRRGNRHRDVNGSSGALDHGTLGVSQIEPGLLFMRLTSRLIGRSTPRREGRQGDILVRGLPLSGDASKRCSHPFVVWMVAPHVPISLTAWPFGWGNFGEGVSLCRGCGRTAGRVPVSGARVSRPRSLVGCLERRAPTSEHRCRPAVRSRRIHAGVGATANCTPAASAALPDVRRPILPRF
jgi:hypothetical protein